MHCERMGLGDWWLEVGIHKARAHSRPLNERRGGNVVQIVYTCNSKQFNDRFLELVLLKGFADCM